jgi:hypothetical protein
MRPFVIVLLVSTRWIIRAGTSLVYHFQSRLAIVPDKFPMCQSTFYVAYFGAHWCS